MAVLVYRHEWATEIPFIGVIAQFVADDSRRRVPISSACDEIKRRSLCRVPPIAIAPEPFAVGGCLHAPFALLYKTGQGSALQISAAYSAMVRSLENLPLLATFRIALCAHAPESEYSAPSRSCA